MNYTKTNKKELTILLVGVGGGGCWSGSAQKQQQQELRLAHLLPPRARTAGESPYPAPLRSLDAFSSPNLSTSQKKKKKRLCSNQEEVSEVGGGRSWEAKHAADAEAVVPEIESLFAGGFWTLISRAGASSLREKNTHLTNKRIG